MQILTKIKIKLIIFYNYLYYFSKGVKYGRELKAIGFTKLIIQGSGKIIIGENFNIISGNYFNAIGRNIGAILRVDTNAKLIIGNNVGISCSSIWSKKNILIGNNVKIGADSIIMDADMHSLNYMNRRNYLLDIENTISSPIIIKDDVFIGTRSIICKGVIIGEKSIIAAGSVVTKSIPPNQVWGGNPAKFIKSIEE